MLGILYLQINSVQTKQNNCDVNLFYPNQEKLIFTRKKRMKKKNWRKKNSVYFHLKL